MGTKYFVSGIEMPGLSEMQNKTVWAIHKLNDNASVRSVAQYILREKGTAIAHLYRLVKKGYAIKQGSKHKGYRFSLQPWVRGEIRKGINRAWGKTAARSSL